MQTVSEARLVTLEEYIIQSQNRFPGATGELSQLLRDIGLAQKSYHVKLIKPVSPIS